MSDNLIIREDGVGRLIRGVDALEIKLQSGGTSRWVRFNPRDQKSVNANGEYHATDDGVDGYRTITVNVPTRTKSQEPGRDQEIFNPDTGTGYYTDDNGYLHEEVVPDEIRIMHVPDKTTYQDGEPIDLEGIVVQAYRDGEVWTSAQYPDGYIPVHELMASFVGDNFNYVKMGGEDVEVLELQLNTPQQYSGWFQDDTWQDESIHFEGNCVYRAIVVFGSYPETSAVQFEGDEVYVVKTSQTYPVIFFDISRYKNNSPSAAWLGVELQGYLSANLFSQRWRSAWSCPFEVTKYKDKVIKNDIALYDYEVKLSGNVPEIKYLYYRKIAHDDTRHYTDEIVYAGERWRFIEEVNRTASLSINRCSPKSYANIGEKLCAKFDAVELSRNEEMHHVQERHFQELYSKNCVGYFPTTFDLSQLFLNRHTNPDMTKLGFLYGTRYNSTTVTEINLKILTSRIGSYWSGFRSYLNSYNYDLTWVFNAESSIKEGSTIKTSWTRPKDSKILSASFKITVNGGDSP